VVAQLGDVVAQLGDVVAQLGVVVAHLVCFMGLRKAKNEGNNHMSQF
jgi:hypothetical protein